MFARNKIAPVLLLLAAVVTLAACAPRQELPTPTLEPTATNVPASPTPESATATTEPTITPIPTLSLGTDTAAQPGQAGTPASPAAAQPTLPAAGNLTPAANAPLPLTPAVPATGGSATAGDKYQYVSQSVPDKWQMRPGNVFQMKWVVKNVGTNAWSTEYTLKHFTGPTMGLQNVIAFPKTVKPGEQFEIAVNMTAPDQPGDYNTWWKLANPQGQNFGDVNLEFTITSAPNNTRPTTAPAS